eukprot:scaffold42594_cov64-Phaeocystis_antarctica.AAC.8
MAVANRAMVSILAWPGESSSLGGRQSAATTSLRQVSGRPSLALGPKRAALICKRRFCLTLLRYRRVRCRSRQTE